MAIDIQEDFKSYQDKVAAALVNVTKSANSISTYDLGFHRSYNPDVPKALDAQNTHLLRLTSKLLKAAAKDTSLKIPALKDQEDVDDNWRSVVDIVDSQLEKADAALDEVNGLVKRQSPSQPSTPEPPSRQQRQNNYRQSPFGMVKPQKFFERRVDNYQTGKWRPLLTSKPHAILPLEECLDDGQDGYNHPYQSEIEAYEFPASVREQSLPIPFTRPENSEPVWVDTEEGVHAMLQELKEAKEIAVDLEHNNMNSYIGMVCLMQISTRTKDWVVDTLRPWREKLQCLNEVFADPNIVKLFHGSSSDIIWLQRDLGLYVVGLFDTYYAATALNYEGKSLAFLLKKHAGFDAQKQFQLADWRIRPLPQDLLDYARSDTHFLLYIYDCLRNDLIACSTQENNLIDYVLEQSKKECLQVYERPIYDRENGLGPEGWLKLMLSRTSRTLDKLGFGIFRALHEWRDNKARELDEGPHSIMSNNYIWGCAEEKPRKRVALFDRRIGQRAPNFIAMDAAIQDEVLGVIKRGAEEGEQGPTLQEVIDRNADKISSFRHFKQNNPNAKPQEINMSLAATMQNLVKNGDLTAPNKVSNGTSPTIHTARKEPVAARSMNSSLFGQLSTSQQLPVHDQAIAQLAAHILVPLSISPPTAPAMTQDSTMAEAPPAEAPPVQPPSDTIALDDGIDDTFTLRNRKRSANNDSEDDTSSPIRLTGFSHKHQNKQPRRARRADKPATEAEDIIPFDYANAPSVLHASGQAETTNQTVKPMNPFAKALDTSTGARRNKFGKEMAGKSHTFSS